MDNQPQKFEVTSLQDIADLLTIDNAPRFLKDFRHMVASILVVKSTMQLSVDQGKIPKEEAKILFPSFTWIDDDKNEITASLRATDSGKETRIDINALFDSLDKYYNEDGSRKS